MIFDVLIFSKRPWLNTGISTTANLPLNLLVTRCLNSFSYLILSFIYNNIFFLSLLVLLYSTCLKASHTDLSLAGLQLSISFSPVSWWAFLKGVG